MFYLDIEKEAIPYTFETVLDNETFQFTVNYNSYGDFFTVDIYKNSVPLRFGEKIVYGQPLFINHMYIGAPRLFILPYDTTRKAERAGYENLSEDVFLYVI